MGGIPFALRIEKPNASTSSAIDDVNKKRNLSDSFSDTVIDTVISKEF